MNREQIKKHLVGHRSLIIQTSDGTEFRAPRPESVWVGRHNVIVENKKGMLDIIDPLHIVSIRPAVRRNGGKVSS